MHKILKYFFVLVVLLISHKAKSSHIVGGYLTYSCLGPVSADSVDYQVTMRFYRDCGGNVGTEPDSIPISIFNGGFVAIDVIWLNNFVSLDTLDPNINNPCVIPDSTVCVQEFIFENTIRLGRNRNHTLVFQRCCKSDEVDNLLGASNDYGSSFVTEIPSYNQIVCNSTPIYDTIPPLYFCTGFDVNIDLSATDPDGDSLAYKLCTPLDYGSTSNPLPIPANPPPYSLVNFDNGFSATNPFPASPQITLDSITGRLNGTPTTVDGRYLIGICIEEWRNGTLINTMRREVEVTTKVCDVVVNSAIQDQLQFCDGLTVQFMNQSTSSSMNPIQDYFWDFGVAGTLGDTSNAFEPSFTYPDTGLYSITLISYPNFPACTDTVVDTFNVKKLLAPAIIKDGIFCADNINADLSVGGNVEPYATVEWDFGTGASISSSTAKVVNGLSYPLGINSYPIELIVNQDGCSDTVTDILTIYPNPTLAFAIDDSTGCAPESFQFTSAFTKDPISTTAFLWNFGDGGNSTAQNVSYQYNSNGLYDVSLRLITDGGCKDTVVVSKPNLVNLGIQFSDDTAAFSFDNVAGCYPLVANFTNESVFEGVPTYLWDFGDGTTSTAVNPTHTYFANGTYDVNLTMTTTGKCAQTVSGTVSDAIKVSLDSSKNMADFIISQDTGCAPVEVTFANTSIYEGAANFKWYFGDGDSSSVLNPTHVYDTEGVFDVQLILNATEKCVDTVSIVKPAAIEVDKSFSTNVVDFDYFPKDGCPPLTVQFADSSIFQGNAKYFWDFGDGTLDTIQNPVKVYQDTGSYSIGLLLIPTERCIDTLVKAISDGITVLPEPIAVLNASETALPLKEAQFNFDNNGSEFVVNSRYQINGVEVGSNDVLNYQFTDTGTYVVDYIATNVFGCEDTSSVKVLVYDVFEFIIPNVFTPNGDRVNDEFKMIACGVYDFDIKIFNRFGEQVFTSNSLGISWDGRVNGRKANSGTYFYTIKILDFRGDYIDYSGTVTLLRD